MHGAIAEAGQIHKERILNDRSESTPLPSPDATANSLPAPASSGNTITAELIKTPLML
jgi:hypothetical protein